MDRSRQSVLLKKRLYKAGGGLLRTIFLLGVGYVTLYPMLLMISSSFMSASDTLDATVVWLPSGFNWFNFQKAFELMKNDPTARALVSIGSTGAVLAGAVLRVGRIKGVKRPAFCPILPTVQNGLVAICDSGANVDCDPIYLQQFAVMGSLYMQKAYGVENPRVALLNIGAESEKGNELAKNTYPLLQETKSINFVGNMEGREVLDGNVDVVVCDGFDGNILLKSTEGACLNMLKLVKRAFMANLVSKMGALLLKKEVMKLKGLMDYNNYGGAVLLGANKTIVKGHGSSKAEAVYQCIKQAFNMENNNLCEAIRQAIAEQN